MKRPVWVFGVASVTLLGIAAPAKDRVVELKAPDEIYTGPLNLAALNRTSQLALTGVPGKSGGFLYAVDRNTDTVYEAKEPGAAHLNLAFAQPQKLRQIRLLLANGDYEWSLAAADSQIDVQEQGATFRTLISPRRTVSLDTWTEAGLDPKTEVRALRLTVTPTDPKKPVRIRELSLAGEQTLQAIEISTSSAALRFNDYHPLTVAGYFSGGETVSFTSKSLEWEIQPSAAARMSTHNRLWTRRRGPLQLRVRFGKLASQALSLEVE